MKTSLRDFIANALNKNFSTYLSRYFFGKEMIKILNLKQMKKIKYILSIAFIIIVFTQCYKQRNYPPEPKIDFRQVFVFDTTDQLGNKIYLYSVYFKILDGDGNFGLHEEDTLDEFYEDTTYIYNFFAELFYLENGEIHEFPVELSFNSSIPYVEPVGLNDYYKALIIYDFEIPFEIPNPIKLEFYIIDRALNKSNTQSTPWIEPGFIGVLADTNNLIID